MLHKFFRFRLAQGVILLLCVSQNGNVFARRFSRAPELQGVAESANLFAEDVYGALTKPGGAFEDRNLLISPLSIDIGLAMLRAGAAGKTEEEITKGLRINSDMEEAEVHNGYKDLIASIKQENNDPHEEAVQVQLANRIYVGQVYPIKPPFLHDLRQHFFAEAEQVDFGEMNKAASKVNGWVQKATNNKIKNIVVPSMLNNQTAMILVSAVHFKGTWKTPFDPESTTKKSFTTLNGGKIEVDMMQLDRPRSFHYGRIPELKASAVSLPYSFDDETPRFSLVVLLPDREQDLRDVESRLKEGTLASIPRRLRSTTVDLRMPKLALESNVDLISSKVIESLDMTSMITDFAEFDRMSDEVGLRITNVIHKTFIDVNEAGSEAAAASAFVAQARSLDIDPGTAVKFVVDRPFIAYIYDSKTKTVLFILRKIM